MLVLSALLSILALVSCSETQKLGGKKPAARGRVQKDPAAFFQSMELAPPTQNAVAGPVKQTDATTPVLNILNFSYSLYAVPGSVLTFRVSPPANMLDYVEVYNNDVLIYSTKGTPQTVQLSTGFHKISFKQLSRGPTGAVQASTMAAGCPAGKAGTCFHVGNLWTCVCLPSA